MAKHHGMQGFLMAGDPESQDQELPTPRSQSQQESYTGWPWTERHDYGQLRPDSTSSITSRVVSGEHEEESLLGVVRMSPAAAGAQHRMQKAVVFVILLNAGVIGLEASFNYHRAAHFMFRLLELGCTVTFLVLLMRSVRAEIIGLTDTLAAKQATAVVERNDETVRTIRADITALRNSFVDKRASTEKDLRARLAKAEAAAATANAETATVLRELEAALGAARAAQATADGVSERLKGLEVGLFVPCAAKETYTPCAASQLQAADPQEAAAFPPVTLASPPLPGDGLAAHSAELLTGAAAVEQGTESDPLCDHWAEAFATTEPTKAPHGAAVEPPQSEVVMEKEGQATAPAPGDLDSTASTAALKDAPLGGEPGGAAAPDWVDMAPRPEEEDGI